MPTTPAKYAGGAFSTGFSGVANAIGSTTGTYATWTSSASVDVATLILDEFDFSEIPAGSLITSVAGSVRSYVNNAALFEAHAATLYLDGDADTQQSLSFSSSPIERAATWAPNRTILDPTTIRVFVAFVRGTSPTSSTAYVDRASLAVTYTPAVRGGFFL